MHICEENCEIESLIFFKYIKLMASVTAFRSVPNHLFFFFYGSILLMFETASESK